MRQTCRWNWAGHGAICDFVGRGRGAVHDLNRELEALFQERGAGLVGFADLSGMPEAGLPRGVSVAVALPPEIVRSIGDGPNLRYYETYHDINARLDHMVTVGAEYLEKRGFCATAQTTKSVVKLDDTHTLLPHKTVATRAGLGWIGRCALLVTEQYGSALRISSLLTDAPLECGQPVDEPRCGGCRECARYCPSGAIAGEIWRAGLPRERMVDAAKCRDTAIALCMARFGVGATICGKCIEVCPYTRRYLHRSEG